MSPMTDPANVASRTIAYNADNLPTEIQCTKGTTVTTTFAYDGDGVRTKKVTGGVTTLYIGAHQERELPAGVVTNYIFAGNQRIAKKVGSVRHYFHQDHLGSATQTSDSNGDVAETTEYLPFGAMRVHSGTVVSNYKFTDQELDQSTGLYNYDARLYDPIIGRFISADSMVPQPYNPQSLNRYSYCYNNPLIYTDPTGHLGDALADALGYEAGDDSMYGENGFLSGSFISNSYDPQDSDTVRGTVLTIDTLSLGPFIPELYYTPPPGPTHISPTGGPITSGFGSRTDPITGAPDSPHKGIDFGAPYYGAPVYASAAGTVVGTRSNQGPNDSPPNAVTIDEGNGGSSYAHVTPSVQNGTKVDQGQVIGQVDDSGRTTGPHVHYQGYDDDWNIIDPTDRF